MVNGRVIIWSLLGTFAHLYEFSLPGHYMENSLICMIFESALLTVWFAAYFILCHRMISTQVIRPVNIIAKDLGQYPIQSAQFLTTCG